MIEGTPQLYTDLILRYEKNALQKSDLEYVEYFLHLFERYLTFEWINIPDEKTEPPDKRLKSDLSVRTNSGGYLDESDLIYFLQVKLNQIMKDFEKTMIINDTGYCLKRFQDLKLLDVRKNPPPGWGVSPHGSGRNREVDYGYQTLYDQCTRRGGRPEAGSTPGYYFYDALSPIDNTYSASISPTRDTTHRYVKGMMGEFKYKFNKINDILRFIDHIAIFLRTKDKWN